MCPFCNVNPSGLFFSFQNKTISLLLFQRHWHCCMWHSVIMAPLGFQGSLSACFFFFFLDQKYYTLFLKLFLERQLVFFIEQHCIYIFFLYIFFLLWVFAVVFLPSLVIVSFYSPSFLYYDFYCLAASTGFFFFYLISKSIFTFIFPTWLTLLCVWNSLLCC